MANGKYGGTAQPYIADRLIRDWVEMEATWISAQAGTPWTTPGGDYTTVGEATKSTGACGGGGYMWFSATGGTIDVTNIVKYWQANPSENYAIILRMDASATEIYMGLSKEGHKYDGSQMIPKLTINSSGGGPVIPEPATLLLVGTGALGLFGYIRRRMLK